LFCALLLASFALWVQGVFAMPISAFLDDQLNDGRPVEEVFGPDEIEAMSMALEDVCKALKLDGKGKVREIVALRIIELARRGERSRTKLRDRVLQEANGGSGC
jgi:hypothetical protein